MIKVIVNGCCGKMGSVATSILQNREKFKVVAGIDKNCSAGLYDFPVYAEFAECKEKADVVLDFSRPEALHSILEYALEHKARVVLATTGYSQKQLALIKDASKKIPVFTSPNMSLGVNLMFELVKQTARFFGNGFDIEIIEKHHNQKVDSPSGTALALAGEINSVFDNEKDFVYGRKAVNQPRTQKEIGIHAVRGGTIVGEHQVIFAGQNEIFEITHKAHSRDVFGIGAVRAVEFIMEQPPGLYSMKDLVNQLITAHQ
ncbi:MAG: 4-hydroxy-tetrahydrodipicolinate reductase [Thermosediminibacterales bacterium]|nr:4-hydroxy-tetrahydrodipicolinate reductase [Thermosediminibacterales bacterium]